MLLIATDEAGYGPRLGPLVIAGTAWNIPDAVASRDQLLEECFEPLRCPAVLGNGLQVSVDDSKALYKSGDSLDRLHTLVSASLHQCGRFEQQLVPLLRKIAADDVPSIESCQWLCGGDPFHFLSPPETESLRRQWLMRGARQIGLRARVLTAAEFNRGCAASNKADLLSERTIGLIRKLIEQHRQPHQPTEICCDRHGGRKFYGGVLQHVFENGLVRVLSETKDRSSYRIELPEDDGKITVHFAVQGDRFPPVALSSIHAKYLRERFMILLNRYFGQRHDGAEPLKPTAGYPVDADRYLKQIESICQRESITRDRLVRAR